MFKPVYMKKRLKDRKLDKAMKKIEKLSQEKLIKAALKAPVDDICLAAVKRLEDQAALAEVAKEAPGIEIRKAALKKLTDQTSIADVAKNGSYDIRNIAMQKLTDQAALAEFAKNDPEGYFRRCAVKKLTDQAVLSEVARTDNDYAVCYEAAIKLTDAWLREYTLEKVSKNATDIKVRIAAVEKLTNQELLKNIAKSKKYDISVCAAAVEALTDQKALADVVKDASYEDIRISALEKITDQSVLADIVKHRRPKEYPDSVRLAAVKKLNDPALLMRFLNRDYNWDIFNTAALKLPVDMLIKCLNEDPEKMCNKVILKDISKRKTDWIKDISPNSLYHIMSVLARLYGKRVYERETIDPDISRSVIEAYRSGYGKDIIRYHAGKILTVAGNHDDVERSCGHSDHYYGWSSLGESL